MSEKKLTPEQAGLVMEYCGAVADTLVMAPREMRTSVLGRFENRLDGYLAGTMTFEELMEALRPKRFLTPAEHEFLLTLNKSPRASCSAQMQN
jgi:hypothetical protein